MPLLEAWDTRDDGSFLGTGAFSRELYARLRHTRRFIVFATVSGIHVLIRDGENRFGKIQRDASASLSLVLVAVVAIDLGIRPRAFASLRNLENLCCVFSRENNRAGYEVVSPICCAVATVSQRCIGRNSSESPSGIRALITKTISGKTTLRICVLHSTDYQRYLTSVDERKESFFRIILQFVSWFKSQIVFW